MLICWFFECFRNIFSQCRDVLIEIGQLEAAEGTNQSNDNGQRSFFAIGYVWINIIRQMVDRSNQSDRCRVTYHCCVFANRISASRSDDDFFCFPLLILTSVIVDTISFVLPARAPRL